MKNRFTKDLQELKGSKKTLSDLGSAERVYTFQALYDTRKGLRFGHSRIGQGIIFAKNGS
jgi:hypothetical protein